jgi:hypothetical protein
MCVHFVFSFLLCYFCIFHLKDITLCESVAWGTKWHIRNEFRVLVANTEGKRPVRRPMHRWKENFNFYIEYEIAFNMGLSWQGLWMMLFLYIIVKDEDGRLLKNCSNWLQNYCFTFQDHNFHPQLKSLVSTFLNLFFWNATVCQIKTVCTPLVLEWNCIFSPCSRNLVFRHVSKI